MNMRALLTLLCGVGLASASVYFVHQKLGDGADTGLVAAEPPIVVGSVVVASTDLAFGHRLRPEHLREAPWPLEAMPEGSFPTIEALLGNSDEERVVLRAMSKGEPVLSGKVSGFGAKATLSTKLENGKRAYSIRVNDVSGVAGFLLPSDRVDVLLTRQLPHRKDLVTDVILQNIVVLGIDQLADEEREQPRVARTATVEVTPKDAQKLALAMQVGTLSLALRNVASAEETKLRTVGVGDLVQGSRPAPARSKPAVRVRRGADVSVERVLFN
jgi:pilus assembly protein CpaB